MTGKDIFLGLRYVDAELIEEAEFGTFSTKAETETLKKRKAFRRPFLLAAIIALCLLLVGCGVVYVLKMQDLWLGSQQVTQERWDDEQKTMVSETVSQQVLTFAGLKGTARYEAAKEWYEFEQTYDPDWEIYHEHKDVGTLDYGPAEYSLYNTYTQEMRDKIDEITEKYGLKLQGKLIKAANRKALYAYLGIDGVLLPDAKAKTDDFNVAYYDGGWLHADMHMTLTDSPDWPYRFLCSLYYSAADTFDTTMCGLNETDDWQEWNYTTQSGHTVLVLRSLSDWVSWVFCDRGDATITLRIETILEWYSDDSVDRIVMTDEQMKQVIDAIDFDIQPTPGDASLLDGPATTKELSQTSNGYTVTIKEVFTDGQTTQIRLGITAPEDVNLEQYMDENGLGGANFDDVRFVPAEDNTRAGSMSWGSRADGDGKANTMDYLIEVSKRIDEGITYQEGSTCKLYLENLVAKDWNNEKLQYDTHLEMEGSWNFEITLDNGDWREIEFVKDPIATNVCYGWDVEGNDVFRDEAITSIKLRAFGADYTAPNALGGLDFANYKEEKYPLLVLKDGTKIKLSGDLRPYDFEADRIPMDEVDRLELIDGTVLYPVEADPDRVRDYQLEVKSAVTDGKTAKVVLQLTVPYGTEMCKENCEYSIGFENFGDYNVLMSRDRNMLSKEELMGNYALGETLEAREDGDGREDTLEIVYTMYADPGEDAPEYFTPGSQWLFHVENMSAERMHYPEGTLTEIEQLWTANGVRNVEITFEAADYVER